MGSNVVEPLRPRFLLSVPTLKSAELREGGLTNVGIQICSIAPLHPPPSYLFTPAAPSHPVRGSVSFPSADPSRGSALASQGLGAEVSILTDVPPSGIACRTAQSLGQLMDAQVGPSVMTSGLTTAQAEEIFLLSREVQTLRGKLALDFIQLSHTEASFHMGAQATSHEYTVQGPSFHGSAWRSHTACR